MEGTLEVFKFSPFILEKEAQKEKAVLRSTHSWMEAELGLEPETRETWPRDPATYMIPVCTCSVTQSLNTV